VSTIRLLLALAVTVAVLLLAACSPEDGRERGQNGADIGNRPDAAVEVDLHGEQDPNHDVPDRLPEAGRTARP
jgi:hypothetical protein